MSSDEKIQPVRSGNETLNEKRRFFDEVSQSCSMDHFKDDEIPRLRSHISLWGLRRGDVVLEVGSGTGRLTPYLLEMVGDEGEVYCIDFSLKMLLKARRREFAGKVRFIQADAVSLPLAERCCDAVVCFSAFPHFPDKRKAVEEFHRVLKPGGRLVISHLLRREEVNALHRRIGGAIVDDMIPPDEEMKELLRTAGFKRYKIINDERGYLVLAS